jgi:hypothetical protein
MPHCETSMLLSGRQTSIPPRECWRLPEPLLLSRPASGMAASGHTRPEPPASRTCERTNREARALDEAFTLRLVSTSQAVAEGTQNGPWRTSLSVEHVFGPSGLSFQSSRGTAADASPFVAQQVGNRTRAGAVITDSGSCTQDGIGRRFRRACHRKEAIGCCDRQRFLFSHTGAECQ